MSPEEIRLEILKLVNRHDHHPVALVARARDLEAYVLSGVLEDPEEPKVNSPKGKVKKTANPDILS